MKILVFGASNSSDSINKKFATSVSKYYKEKEDVIEIIDLNDFEMPLFSKDKEREIGLPNEALHFAEKIDNADLILISFAENNGNYNVGYKNLVDWTSRIKGRKVYNGKPVFLLATSQGRRGGQSVLQIATERMPFDGAEVLETFSLPEFDVNFEEGKGVTTPLLRSQLEAKVRKTKRLMAERLAQ
ncbi:NADPH-dependent FMN reductase [Sphingobacterium yanglingense]|uniref:NAD(P)H-dependent FMN reductase n=1 Tax=Sphingobacterium yanglingense TaxID=1437280 RepID=A0A4R6WE58_9SPHI|nr:NAD(P)H-dependent oxidoreductase [Sphingobacterium yanglingense]TDQ78023.1 NAD(P)H-dependent FMN reductase [Sphingobacterium yanglingense]